MDLLKSGFSGLQVSLFYFTATVDVTFVVIVVVVVVVSVAVVAVFLLDASEREFWTWVSFVKFGINPVSLPKTLAK